MDYNWRDDVKYVVGALASDNALIGADTDALVSMAAERIVEENGADWYARPKTAVQEEMTEFHGGSLTLWAIPQTSWLYELLVKWHGTEASIYDNARNAFCDDENMYFVTGMGYDIMSADLLGGTADGQAARDFEAFVRQYQA